MISGDLFFLPDHLLVGWLDSKYGDLIFLPDHSRLCRAWPLVAPDKGRGSGKIYQSRSFIINGIGYVKPI